MSEQNPTLRIDISVIPDFRREQLAKGALMLVEQAFSMPGAEERYQAWLKERRAKQERAAKAKSHPAKERSFTYETEKEPCVGGM